MKQKVFLASDHAGFECKEKLFAELEKDNDLCKLYKFINLGPHSIDSVDYPDYADKVCLEILNHLEDSKGILICGSGQGMAIRANKYSQIRAALCWSNEVATLSRQHNNANILCFGARVIDFQVGLKMTRTFLSTAFEGGRHQKRVEKLSSPT